MSNTSSPQQILVARLIAVGIVFAVLVITAIALAIATGTIVTAEPESNFDPGAARLMRTVMFAIGAAFPFLSILYRRVADARAFTNGAPPQRRFQNMLIALALCEVPAILGLVSAVLLHDVKAVLLLGLFSIVACALHFPRRDMFGPQKPDHL